MSCKRYDPPVWDEKSGRFRPAHDVIWEKANGQKIPNGHVIHHVDGNGHNNDPKNLQLMTNAEHIGLHSSLRHSGKDVVDATDPDVIEDRRKRREWFKKFYPNHKAEYAARDKHYKESHKEEVAERGRNYYCRNRTKLREQQRIYEETHKDARAARNTAYAEEHHDERIEYLRAYRKANIEEIRAKDRARYEVHREERRASALEFRKKRRALLAARQRLYTAKKKGKSQDILTALQKVVDREEILLMERLQKEGKN